MADDVKRWLVRKTTGQIFGPYSTQDVIDRIQRGKFVGDEEITIYPGGNWLPISTQPEFYDQLLDSLKAQGEVAEESIVSEVDDSQEESVMDDFEPSEIGFDPDPDQVETVKLESTRTRRLDDERTHKSAIIEGAAKRFRASEAATSSSVIELKSTDSVYKKNKARSMRLPLLFLAGAIAVFIILDMDVDKDSGVGSRVRLTPVSAKASGGNINTGAILKRALSVFARDTLENYRKAEGELVAALEANPNKPEVWGLLCLTYYRIWPFAYQDRKDLSTVAEAQSRVNSLSPGGLHAATCRITYQLVKGNFVEAKGQLESALQQFESVEPPPVYLYYLKAVLLGHSKDYLNAIGYVTSAQQMWPQWLALYSLEGHLLMESNQMGKAAARFQEILKSYSGHTTSQLQLGILESRHFGHPEKAKALLIQGLKDAEKVDPLVVADAYYSLAEIFSREGDGSRALGYAKRAYKKNPNHSQARELLRSLAGTEESSQLEDRELIYQGDLFFREGDLNAAQAHYVSAYEANPQNALAAFKAATCMWQLSFSTEAIDWLNKAIKADPKYIDAYVLLADYYSQRFDYLSAGKVLRKASGIKKESFEIYRGYALLALRQGAVKDAIQFAQKASVIYGSDAKTYIILSKAQGMSGDYSKSFASAAKAIELDMNSTEAQVAYAEALGLLQGREAAIQYLMDLIQRYPTIDSYRLALADTYMANQNFQAAVEVYDQVIRIDQKALEAYLGKGKAFRQMGDVKESLDAFLRAAVADPADPRPLFEAGLLYLSVNRYQEAKKQFQRVLSLNGIYPLANYHAGRADLALGNTKGALDFAEQERKGSPNRPEPYILKAEAYTKMRNYTLCAGEYQKAVQYSSGDANIYIKMAGCYLKIGNTDVALSMLNRAKQIESGNPKIYKLLASIYEAKNDLTMAREAYEKYLILYPNAKDAGLVRQKIQSLQTGRGF